MYPLKLEAVPMYSKKNWFSLVQVEIHETSPLASMRL